MAVGPGKRKQVWDRDGGCCRYCGDVGQNIDHVLARARNGSDDLSNLVLSCIDCNDFKSDYDMEERGMMLLPSGTQNTPMLAAFIRARHRRLASMSKRMRKIEMSKLVDVLSIPQDFKDSFRETARLTRRQRNIEARMREEQLQIASTRRGQL